MILCGCETSSQRNDEIRIDDMFACDADQACGTATSIVNDTDFPNVDTTDADITIIDVTVVSEMNDQGVRFDSQLDETQLTEEQLSEFWSPSYQHWNKAFAAQLSTVVLRSWTV